MQRYVANSVAAYARLRWLTKEIVTFQLRRQYAQAGILTIFDCILAWSTRETDFPDARHIEYVSKMLRLTEQRRASWLRTSTSASYHNQRDGKRLIQPRNQSLEIKRNETQALGRG